MVEDYLAFLLTLGSTSSLGSWEEAAQFLVLPLLGSKKKKGTCLQHSFLLIWGLPEELVSVSLDLEH